MSLNKINRFLGNVILWVGIAKIVYVIIIVFKFVFNVSTIASGGTADNEYYPGISAIIGFIFCFVSFLMILVIVLKTLFYGDPVGGWPSLVCIIFMVSGIQLFCMGIMGEYMAKTYLETKKRPIYIVKEKVGFDIR